MSPSAVRVLVELRSLLAIGDEGLAVANPTITLEEMVRRVGRPVAMKAGWAELAALGLATTVDHKTYTLTPAGVELALRTPADALRQGSALKPHSLPRSRPRSLRA